MLSSVSYVCLGHLGACVDSVCGGTFLEERCPRPQFFSNNSNFF